MPYSIMGFMLPPSKSFTASLTAASLSTIHLCCSSVRAVISGVGGELLIDLRLFGAGLLIGGQELLSGERGGLVDQVVEAGVVVVGGAVLQRDLPVGEGVEFVVFEAASAEGGAVVFAQLHEAAGFIGHGIIVAEFAVLKGDVVDAVQAEHAHVLAVAHDAVLEVEAAGLSKIHQAVGALVDLCIRHLRTIGIRLRCRKCRSRRAHLSMVRPSMASKYKTLPLQ